MPSVIGQAASPVTETVTGVGVASPIPASTTSKLPTTPMRAPGFPAESLQTSTLTRPAASADVDAFWSSLGVPPSSVHAAPGGSELPAAILQSRFGVELWQYLVWAALILALLEMVVARDSRKDMQS